MAQRASRTAFSAFRVPAKPLSGVRLPRRQHHHHLAALEAGLLLDLGDFRGITLDSVEELIAELLVRHLAAAEPQRHLDLVAFLEEALDRRSRLRRENAVDPALLRGR